MTLLNKLNANKTSLEMEDSSLNEIEIKSEVKSSNEKTDFQSDNEQKETNEGWADSIAKILKTKKPKNKKTLVLSKAKKLTDVKQKKKDDVDFQIDGEIKEEKPVLSVLDKIKEEVVSQPRKNEKKSQQFE